MLTGDKVETAVNIGSSLLFTLSSSSLLFSIPPSFFHFFIFFFSLFSLSAKSCHMLNQTILHESFIEMVSPFFRRFFTLFFWTLTPSSSRLSLPFSSPSSFLSLSVCV
jgi:hypothetical protein